MALTVYNDTNQINVDSFYNNMAVSLKVSKAEMQNLGVYEEGWKFKRPFSRVTTNLDIEGRNLKDLPVTPFKLYRVEIPANIINPIGAVSVILGSAFCGGIHTISGKKYFSIYTAFTGDFTVYIYSSNKINTENYGLEVYNPSGQLVFDSENRYLKILENVDNSKACAMILQGAVLAQETPRGYSTSWIDFLWGFIINTNGTIEEVKVYSETLYSSGNLNNYSRFPKPVYNNTPIIIDVTNF